ncbi:MAG TPA: hypothetical protein PLL30_17000 [Candidatus Krumholzibacteria bacterium]|nr:hypothetical protein [Candidatus Krumholzibacteria bacterium]HPD73473.1 hypothetical protein [Candidatus Krumholzibacteria bacterium]HRY42196.1 hypothetical protein [Candidatus Krumholzibacteria bacterium]
MPQCCKDKAFNRALRCILQSILCVEPEPQGTARLTLLSNGVTVEFIGDFTMFLPVDKKVGATVSFLDAAGNAAAVEGAPVWGTDRPDLLSVVASADGFSAEVAPLGPLGSAQVTCTADADLGEGLVPLLVMGQVEVIAGQAVAGVINFSEPV